MKEISLDEKIGRLLGLPFRTKFWIMDLEEKGVFIEFDYKKEADEYLEKEVKKYPDGMLSGSGAHVVKRHIYPGYSFNLETAKIVVDAMGERGFWLRLTSPFMPTEELRPKNPDFEAEWERTRKFWYASFDFHGTTDTHPPWQAGSENPAEAIVLAAIKCVEGNPEIFGIKQEGLNYDGSIYDNT